MFALIATLVILGLAFVLRRRRLAKSSTHAPFVSGRIPSDDRGYVRHFPSRPEATILGKVIGDVVDASTVRQRPVQDLFVININDVFEPGQVLIGFGVPNAFVASPDENGGYKKFSAKSLKRGPALVTSTKGILQSGIMLRFRNLPPAALGRITSSMEAHADQKYWTCANACLRMLKAAGFELTNGKKSLDDLYMPHKTLSWLLRHGLSFDGEPVDFDVVRTTPDPLQNFTAKIVVAEARSISRHLKRKFNKNKTPADNSNNAPDIEAPDAPPLPDGVDYADDIEVKVSRAAYFGALMRLMWGAHPLYEAEQQRVDAGKYFTEPLTPFNQPKPSLVTRIKKEVLFRRFVIRLIHRFLAPRYTSIGRRTEADIHDMLRTNSGKRSNVYNLVITAGGHAFDDDEALPARIIIARISVGQKLIDWILSKHVLMSKYDKTVVFAGELWKDENGVIHITRNSGTYQPLAEALEAARAYLSEVFPHLTFVVDDDLTEQ